jgi:hypothetical protein
MRISYPLLNTGIVEAVGTDNSTAPTEGITTLTASTEELSRI